VVYNNEDANMEEAQIGYEAWVNIPVHMGGYDDLPTWDEMSEEEKNGWRKTEDRIYSQS
jgi:hypothetical protein